MELREDNLVFHLRESIFAYVGKAHLLLLPDGCGRPETTNIIWPMMSLSYFSSDLAAREGK